MESEEDMQDARSETSEDDLYRNDEDDCESDRMSDGYEDEEGEEDDDQYEDEDAYSLDVADYSAVDEAEAIYARKQLPFTVLTEKAITQRQEAAIESVVSVLSLSKTQAGMLLRNFEWCVNRVHEEWFADEFRVRDRVGLLEKSIKPHIVGLREIKCGICLEYHPIERMQAACCDHVFCLSCWAGYAHTSISDGPGCLSLRCPNPDCNAAAGEDLILSLVPEEDKKKYRRYILRSYVEANRKAKWCPAPGCENAVEFTPGSGLQDVTCDCGHNFCWKCSEEAHRPVECTTVARWILKNSAESENMNWILANSKPCPKCKRPIEKNLGCMHITCTPPCKFEFCWLCLGAWTEHGERTGGFYACNRYEAEKKEGKHDETERRREMAKNSLERYTHYYERWASNEQSKTKALSDLRHLQTSQLEKLSDRHSLPISQLKFITEAWLQIIECRRVLKWTYAYGYYLAEEDVAKKQFFEYLQGEAEAGLERLHQCAEKEFKAHLDGDPPTENFFNDFRTKLAGLTTVTRNYFQNLVKALENGLADVESSAAGNSMGQGSSKGKNTRPKANSSKGDNSGRLVDEDGHWVNLWPFRLLAVSSSNESAVVLNDGYLASRKQEASQHSMTLC
ncbi:hypothetical protein GOP47_0002654 [Adiantum capillus-veneris]|uniref:RBR-type E3 ubiquitin transferase n=1 Tax=Adiantum capillus-veneris TaxID=13818 RepID=A0A9D4VC06_ADICA|nr:hypothetical protein GOP47_0002654 [Adiantum capillus-veneris]